ncbi:P-loop NTPase family protein [Desulfobacula phenolica]|uniref:MoxR-like ATPase n=1 Tax=Desulfobacula phenolica TaxID=90732 RepID=A0A1H2K8N6_9BACT|nr:AAA family ATPase [Desulfobacula phenolica]SDU64811.1 MoxR-like ATPase [Desulfobacula phenolica]
MKRINKKSNAANGRVKWGTAKTGDIQDIISYAKKADIPIQLCGKRGIGKSEILIEFAKSLGLDYRVFDLSIMDPTDLVGMPIVENGRTTFAPPADLPVSGEGIIILEELNRCDFRLQTACLQLLTARRLNGYFLPKGWLVCSAINPTSNDEYSIKDMGPALESRWININVVPDEDDWCAYAEKKGYHSDIITYVRNSRPFDDSDANPRAWTNASKILFSWEMDGERERNPELLKALLSGVLTNKWAEPFLGFYYTSGNTLSPLEIINDYPRYQDRVKEWIKNSQMDKIKCVLWELYRYLNGLDTDQHMDDDGILLDQEKEENMALFFSDLPIDFLENNFDWLKNLGIEEFLLTGETNE